MKTGITEIILVAPEISSINKGLLLAFSDVIVLLLFSVCPPLSININNYIQELLDFPHSSSHLLEIYIKMAPCDCTTCACSSW